MQNNEKEELLNKVKELEVVIVKLNESIEKSKQFIDIDSAKESIKLYVIGKYIEFDREKGILSILVDGSINYYELDNYGSSRLPFPGSRVLIFNIESVSLKKPLILGFEKGRLIDIAPVYEANIFSIDYIHNTMSVRTSLFGNITLTMSTEFLKNIKVKCGNKIQFKSVRVATELLFIPMLDQKNISIDKNEIYSFLSNSI